MADLSIGTTVGGFTAYHAGNYFPDKTTVGLNNLNNWGASDSHTTASSTTYATSAAVKAAYDAAIAAVNALTAPAWGSITGKPATYTPSAHTHTAADITDLNNQNAGIVANTLALRDASSDLSARLFRSNYANETTMSGALAFRIDASNNYIRYCSSPAAVRAWLDAVDSNHTHPGSLLTPINLGTEDLDTIKSPGQYAQNANVNTSAARHYPEMLAGSLIVTVGAGCQQRYHVYNSSRVYVRAQYGTEAWTPWVRQFNTEYFPTAAQVGAMADGGSYGTATFSNWIRTTGQTGWYNTTYGGGMYMIDASWVRVYNGKALYCAGEGAFAGNVTAYYSDERLKEVTSELDPDQCLAAVNKWRKVRYHANDLGAQFGYDPKKAEIGLLAGEVYADFPELTPLAPFDFETSEDGVVSSKSGENYRTMTYERIVAVQAAAITALTRRLEKLEGKSNG